MDDDLERLIKILGSMILSLIIVAIPVICGFCYGIGADTIVKFFLTLFVFGEAIVLWALMWGSIN